MPSHKKNGAAAAIEAKPSHLAREGDFHATETNAAAKTA